MSYIGSRRTKSLGKLLTAINHKDEQFSVYYSYMLHFESESNAENLNATKFKQLNLSNTFSGEIA
jgi:arginyl-tRNA--protein-N-Asp/Glu arginylyltransferase